MLLIRLLRDKRGTAGIEYAAAAAIISTAGVAAMSSIGDQVLDYYDAAVENYAAATSLVN